MTSPNVADLEAMPDNFAAYASTLSLSDIFRFLNKLQDCRKCSDDNDVYYWEYTPDKAKGNVLGMEIVRDQSGKTLRVSQSRFYNEKLVQTLLEGYSILSLEVSLSRDCDVEKNDKWSYICGWKPRVSDGLHET
ncbi:hypothetical protein Tco_1513011 [Tanacetum coccineum]